MLKNKDFKSKKIGDYNKVIITRGMSWQDLENYSLENKKNFESLKYKLFLFVGKKLKEAVVFGEGEGTGTEIVDTEREDFQKDYYNDIVILKNTSAFAVYSEFNAPICIRIQQQNDIIVSLVNNRGDKAICKLDINKIENLSKIIKNLENPNKKSEIEAIIYCHKEEIIPIKNIVMFKEKIEKLGLKEDGIIRYEMDKGYVVNLTKLICDILFEYKVSSDIQIIKNEEEDINNLMLFI